MNELLEKTPPQAIEIEKVLIGTILVKPTAVHIALSSIINDAFYSKINKIIYATISDLSLKNKNIDTVTVIHELKQNKQLDFVGGLPYITSLTSDIPFASRVEGYCDIINDKYRARQLLLLSQEIQEGCYTNKPTSEISNIVSEKFFKIITGNNTDARPIKEILSEVWENIEERSKSGKNMLGISTGFIGLDRMLSGLPAKDLIILAARPSMGKTALAINIMQNVAQSGGRSLVFSLEMSNEQLVTRQLSTVAGINQTSLRNGVLRDEDWPKLVYAYDKLKGLDIIIDETPALSVVQLRARAKMIHARKKLSLVVVDYLQLMKGKGNNRTEEITDISGNLKALAKELNIPVLALSQLNRGLENRTDKRPLMSDLRESGAIEQDADTIMFIYRDDMYNKSDDNPDKGLAEIIIGKQRSGPTGTVKMVFDKPLTKFKDFVD